MTARTSGLRAVFSLPIDLFYSTLFRGSHLHGRNCPRHFRAAAGRTFVFFLHFLVVLGKRPGLFEVFVAFLAMKFVGRHINLPSSSSFHFDVDGAAMQVDACFIFQSGTDLATTVLSVTALKTHAQSTCQNLSSSRCLRVQPTSVAVVKYFKIEFRKAKISLA
jgi:hypothetical protein